MRDILLVGVIGLVLGLSLLYPFAGVILWTWLSIQNPHQEAYTFSRALPLSLIVAVVTVFAWAASRERKRLPNDFIVWAMLIFLAWTTFNSFFAFSPEWSWPYWNRTWKIFALGLMIAATATNRVRIQAIVWVVVISLLYFGVKGGLFTLVTGGHWHVYGPDDTIISDNNQLALALLMALPLANYLRTQTGSRYMGLALSGGIGLTLIAIVGSYSRGALIALGALAVAMLLRTRRKFLYLAIVLAFGVLIANFMPREFWDRANTIQAAGTDASFQDRVLSWQVAYKYASDHFPFGAGFYGPQLKGIYNTYFPGVSPHAAHSIYFQVLGENGFVGLAIYLALLLGTFWKSASIMRRTQGRPELEWCWELARMIQLSLLCFCVGGAALSMAYYDVFIICAAMLVPMSAACAGLQKHQPSITPTGTALPLTSLQ